MKNIVIIGGTKGIGKSIVNEVVENHNVVCLSRNETDFSHNNYTFHRFDALVDDYPDLDSVDCLIYCPGSINLKPISTLSLDDFRNDNPKDYMAGFPWHPHRGIETITYVLEGKVEHKDSIGNEGDLLSGDVQWMTAGKGVVHDEFHSEEFSKKGGVFEMVQLWINLPKKNKMTEPKYQEISSEVIPTISLGDNLKLRVIAGNFEETKGPSSTFTKVNLYDLVSKENKSKLFIPLLEKENSEIGRASCRERV